MYRHAITGETTETPRIAGTPWTSVLMQSLPLLAAPGMVKGKVVWAAELVHWSPTINNTLDGKGNVGPKSGDNGAGSDGNNVSKVNPLLAGRPGTGFVLKGDARTTTPVEQNVSSVAVPAEPVDCSDTTTVFDVLTYAESGSGQGSPFSEEFMTLRQVISREPSSSRLLLALENSSCQTWIFFMAACVSEYESNCCIRMLSLFTCIEAHAWKLARSEPIRRNRSRR